MEKGVTGGQVWRHELDQVGGRALTIDPLIFLILPLDHVSRLKIARQSIKGAREARPTEGQLHGDTGQLENI